MKIKANYSPEELGFLGWYDQCLVERDFIQMAKKGKVIISQVFLYDIEQRSELLYT